MNYEEGWHDPVAEPVMSAIKDAPVHWDVTRIALIEALAAIPIGGFLTLEARAGWADAILAQLPEASPMVTEEQAREISRDTMVSQFREAFGAQMDLLEAAARASIAAMIRAQKVPCPEHPMPPCWTCGRNGAFERAARIALGESYGGWEQP